MSDEQNPLQERIKALEDSLQFDSRLSELESRIKDRAAGKQPWWRDAKTVTILGALIAAILPLATWISNIYASSRESHRLLVEQQEKIRQTYLDRALRPGATEAERERVFGLLSILSSDAELQRWAQGELKKTHDSIEALKKQKEDAERRVTEAAIKVDAARRQLKSEKKRRSEAEDIASNATKQLLEAKKQLAAIDQRLGNKTAPRTCSVLFLTYPDDTIVAIWSSSGSGFTPLTLQAELAFPVDLEYGLYRVMFMHQGYKTHEIDLKIDEKYCPDHISETLEKIEK
jgi:hypothetical protein